MTMWRKSVKNVALVALATWCGCALANPEKPQVVNGSATFSRPNANTLNVTNSRNAIINWQSFNIGKGQTTNFIQPSSSSAVMNRVMGNNPSRIYGNLNSNGKVFLINQHGMMIGAGARINTAGFYGSTLNITNEDFLKGNLKFEGGGFGGINNQGYIHAGPNGNVVLIAPDIENGGVIEVDNGNVILAAGESIRITSLNDASIEFDVQSRDNSIINLGDIIAKQGAARLFAGNLKHSGSINATGIVRNADGSISLVAQQDIEVTAGATLNADGDSGGNIRVQSHHGDVYFSGSASARGESHHGGSIQILGERVGLFGEARVDVSGKTGGGEILVGGDFQGQGDTQTARQSQVSRGASLHADALDSGDGGKVIVWADDFTIFNGEASARGGDVSGDGGFIEISGKETLNFDGLVDTTAANGDTGSVLFDPRNISVFPGSGTSYSGVDDTFAENSSTDVTFSNASIEAALNGANVVLQANNNISWNGPLTPTGSNDLTLQAGQSVFIFDTQTVFTTNGGNLTLIANSTAADGVVDADRLAGAADIVIGDGVQTATVDTGGGDLVIEIRDGAGITNAQQGSVIFDGLSSTQTFDGALTVTAPDTSIFGAVSSGAASFSGNLDLREGSFFSNGDVTVGGITVWNPTDNGGTALDFDLIGSGSFFANGGFNLGTNLNNDTLTLDKILVVGGPSLWQDFGGAGSVITGSGVLVNTDILDIQNQAQLDIGVTVTNNGEIDKSTGAGLLSFTSFLTMGAGSLLNIDTGSVAVATTLTLAPGSVLEGFGTLTANVFSSGGTVNIDGSTANTGTLTIVGDLTLDTNSTLVFDFCNDALCTENDQLNVTGDVVLAGNLVGFWADQFTAPSATTFTLIPAATSIIENPLNVFGPAGVSLGVFANSGSSFDFTMTTVDTGNIIFWTNPAGGNWSVDSNWLGGTAPAADQYAVVNVASDIITITMDTPEAVAGVEIQNNFEILDGGLLTIDDLGAGGTSTITGSVFTLNGTGPGDGLRTNVDTLIAAQTSWNAGDLSGNRPLTIHQVGSLNIGPAAGNLDTILLHNSETGSTWSGGLAAGSGAITNTGTIDISGAFGSPIPIDNTPLGTIIKSDASTTTLAGTVTAGGNFQVEAGTLSLTDPVSINGTFDVASGATLQFSGSGLSAAGIFQGSGTVDISSVAGFTTSGLIAPGGAAGIGILTFDGDLDNIGQILLEIESLPGVAGVDYDQLVVTGNADLQGFMNLIGINEYIVTNGDTLVPITYGSSSTNTIAFGPVGTETVNPTFNANDLTLVLNAISAIFWDDGGAPGNWFDVLNWSTDALPTSGDDVTINGTDLTIDIAGAAEANTLSLAAGYTLNLNSGSLTIAGSAQIDGDLSISGGVLTGSGNITVDGNFAWTGGTLAGNGLLATSGTSTINPAADLTLGRNWTNSGTLTWSNGNITLNNSRTFINTAIFNANAGATFTVASGADDVDNQGTLNVNSDTAFQGLGGLANSGSFVIASATTLSIGTGTSLESGTWTVGDGAVDITGGLRFLNDGFNATSSSGSLTISGGSLNVNTTAPLTLPATLTVNVSGGSLTGSGDLVVDGGFNWTGGNLTGTGLLTTNATSTLNQPGGLTLSRDWTNAGTLNWQAGNVILNTGRTFTNTAIFNADAGAFFGVNSGTETFVNQGTLNVNVDTTFQGGGSLDNSGSFVIAAATTLSIATGVSSDIGTWTIGDGAVDITGGSRTLNDGFSVTSATGSLTVSGGVLEVNTSSPLTLPATLAFNLSSGALTGSGDIVVDGAFAWTGGSLTGPGLFTTNATSTLNQPANLAISRDWVNAGTLNWQAGDIQINSARTFTNTGTFNANAGAIFSVNTGLETFNNQSTVNVNTSTTFGGGGALDNSGSFVVASATTLTIGTGSGSDSGTWDIGLGGINIAVGTRTLDDGFNAIATGGTLSISGGTLDVNTSSPLTLPAALTLDLLAGNLTGSGDLVLDGVFNWTGGSITGAGLLTTNAASLLNQVGGLTLGRDWTAVGAVTWAAGNFTINNNATLISTQSFDANADGQLISLNAGTLFDNQGNFNLGGNISINNGALFEHNGGLFDLNGFTLTVTGALLVNGGELGGSGAITGDLVNGGGTIHPGGADTIGTIAISGNFTNTSGTVVIEIDDDVVTAGVSYDLITVGGQADLNDTLSLVVIGGYTAVNNDVLSPITFGSSVNTFTAIIPTGIETITPDYLPPSLDLTLTLAGGIVWVGGATGVWSVPANWSGNTVPTLADDVSIGAADVTITTVPAAANTITLAGAGELILQDNSLEIDSNSTLSGLLTINGGTLIIDDMTLTLNGGLDWNGGNSTISGAGTGVLVNNAGSTITASGGITTLNNVTVNNIGTFINAQVVTNDFRMAGAALINNTGSFDIQNDVSVFDAGGGGSITNTGTIIKSGGAGSASFATGIAVDNVGGTITVVGTALNLDGGGSHSGSGTFTGPVNLSAGTFTIADASTISGNLNVSGAIVNVEGGLSVDVLNVTLGTINVDSLGGGSVGDTLLVNTGLNWSGNAAIVGGGSGILDVASGATANVAGGISSFDALTVDNNGTFVNAQAGLNDFRLENAAVFNNFGSFEIINAVNIFSLSANATFNNTGSFITNGNTDVFLGIGFVNTGGTVDIQGGILSLNGGVAPLTLDAGSVLTGVGTFNGNVINNGGTVEPGGVGSVGTLSITGNFTNTAGSVVIDILNAVATAGADYDQLAVANQADFGDTLTLNVIGTYVVANSDTLDPITYATYGGTPFATIVPVGGEAITPDYTAPDLTLTLSFAGLFTFTGAVDGVWNNPGNWDLGVPGIGNDALIPAGFNVTIAAAASAGTLSLAAGSTLDINSGGVLTIASSASFDGLLSINAGGLNITGAVATVNAGLNWTGTSVITGGTLNLNSAFNVSGGVTNILDGVNANVAGDTTYGAGNLTLANGSALNINGIFDFAGNVGIVDGGGATSSFNSFNGATIVKSAGVNSTVDSTVTSAHAGSVDVRTGTLDLNLALLDLGPGDVFSGSGTYIGDVTNNGGIVRPGTLVTPVGTLTVTGNFTHNAGILEIETSAAAVFDQLAVTNGIFTGGTIDVSLLGFIPTVALQQPVIVCAVACSGSFANITSPAGIVYGQTTNANDLTLDVASVSFAWDGGGDGVNWTDPLNWSLDVAPDNTIDVVLPGINVAVNGAAFANDLTLNGSALSILGGGTLTLTNLTTGPGSNLTIAGGALVTTGLVQIAGAFNLNSGTLDLVAGGTLLNLNNNWRGGTITGGAPLVLGVAPGDTTLALSGAADKTLDTITLDMNLNDISVSDSGNLVLANGAVIDNTGGQSFIHGGSGDIIGSGTFINIGGLFANVSGQTTIGPNVDFITDALSTVAISGGTLVMQDADAGDLATYQVGGNGVLQVDANRTFGDGSTGGVFNSAGTVHVSGTAVATMNLVSGQFVTNNLVLDSAATLAGDPVTVLSGFLWNGGILASSGLTTAPGSRMSITSPSVLPAVANINGDVELNNPTGTTLDLNGNLLQLNNATLSGSGDIIGNVNNASGVVVTGGTGNLDTLQISGNYSQGGGSALVVEVFNNGFNTVSDQLVVTGSTNLNGGALVIGFTTNSLGLVTADFSPLDLQGGVSGNFSRVFDAGGNILFINFNAGVFTVLGTTPKIPDAVIDDLISFAENSEEFAEAIASNRSAAEAVMEELLREEEQEQGSLVCN